ncbi:MAG TPA: FMN-binding protein, partial [Acidimicrobiales bacterium]|nr:FMN-binding protein [Acidimicrobiales bacterium]
ASATGASEQYGYGVLSVRVTVTGGKISDVQLANIQTAESYSQQIANQVIPYLNKEVISKQTARIYGISGATYTSEAYATSVQSALDKLKFQ